jgi:hypothetical protein
MTTNKITRFLTIVLMIVILFTMSACDNGDGDDSTNDNSSTVDYYDRDPLDVCEGQEGDNLRACVSAFIQARADHEAQADEQDSTAQDDNQPNDMVHSEAVQSVNPVSPIVCTMDNSQPGCNP